MKGLYIHIPFCKAICSYCDFKKQLSYKSIDKDYIDKLIEEINNKKEYLKDINTVYIGGGTPNSLSLSLLNRLLEALKPYLDISLESTIELNPELVNDDLVALLNKYKINRVSLGVQTINNKLINILNRHHNIDIVKKAYSLLSKDIENINLDFMFGIPGQTLENIYEDISLIIELKPTHISYYSLILEPNTVLAYKYSKKEIKLLDDDLIADMNEAINIKLKDLGYHHYETSNYAINGYESKHNLIYWTMDEYIGCGVKACSFVNNTRIENSNTLNGYLNNSAPIIEKLSNLEKRNEFMFLGLRMLEGIDLLRYNDMFKSDPITDYKLIDLLDEGVLIKENNHLRINEKYIFVSNQILVRFVGDKVEE